MCVSTLTHVHARTQDESACVYVCVCLCVYVCRLCVCLCATTTRRTQDKCVCVGGGGGGEGNIQRHSVRECVCVAMSLRANSIVRENWHSALCCMCASQDDMRHIHLRDMTHVYL